MPKKTPFELPDSECKRLTRPEMASLSMVMALASNLHFSKDDLKERLESIPGGTQRMNMLLGSVDSLFLDLIGTVCDRQRRQLRNQARDMKIQIVPTWKISNNKILIHKDEMKELVNCARYKCRQCADTGEEARKCRLYKWLEINVPLDDYGDDLICPYARVDWEE